MVRLRPFGALMSPPPQPPPPPEDVAPDPHVVELIVELGRALHRFGTPAQRLEGALESAARALGVHAAFFSTPTTLMISFGESGQHGTRMLREVPGAVDLGRLTRADAIGQAVVDGEVTVTEGLADLRTLRLEPVPRARWLWEAAAVMLAAFAVTLPLGGTWLDTFVAAAAGLGVGLSDGLFGRFARTAQLRIFGSSLIAGATVQAAGAAFPINGHLCAIGALIALLPGLSLTTAMTELATQHLASGTARFAQAAVVLVQMGLGLAIGSHLVAGALEPALGVPDAWAIAPGWAAWALVPLVAGSFWLLFRAEWVDLPWILLASYTALAGAELGVLALGPTLGSFIGAMLVGVLSHVYSRWRDRPVANVLVPGVTILVPGSIGLSSLTSFLEQDVTGGTQAAVTMTLVAISLVFGILVSAWIVRPRGNL